MKNHLMLSELAKKQDKRLRIDRLSHRQGYFYNSQCMVSIHVKSFIDLLGLDMSDVDPIATYVSPLE